MSYFAKSVLCSVLVFAAIVVIACCALAQTPVLGSMVIRGPLTMQQTGASCATTDTSWARDVFLEGFPSPLENTPAATVGTGLLTAGYDTTALSTGKIAGQCNSALRVLTTGTDGTEHRYRWDLASPIDLDTTPVTIRFRLYWVTALPTNAQNFGILSVSSTTTPSTSNIGAVVVNYNGSVMQIRVAGSYVTLPVGQWVTCEWYIDPTTTGNLSSFAVNGGTPQYFNRGANDLQYIHAGAVLNLDSGENCEFIFDLLAID